MGKHNDKNLMDLLDDARAQGWVVTRTERGHYKAIPADPTKPVVFVATSGDHRALDNALRDLKKSGLVVPERQKLVKLERRSEVPVAVEETIEADRQPPEPDDDSNHRGQDERNETHEETMERLFAEQRLLPDAAVVHASAAEVGDAWIHPVTVGIFSLKDAVKLQMKCDETRMAFLAKHLKTNLL